ncbi:hypothetical protein COJ46_07910 [Bacillus sp. AFS077874]|nr:hypothetical protein CON00_06000 [Bacillus sp. AFS096315]PET77002.1 hypothetical protein CN514_01590 [Bacillus sp. AFS001701]PFH91921.1 hypothetical protein COI44_00715 [Bacillus sp. AFS088145]PFM81984.1 hypothetical protein COJ46_07910 [Bacillus sp. AFS077874]PGM59146.1 hypothetical protein CN946_02690 [Bacillus sp. AFS053548]
MMKKSRLYESFRELTVGASQYGHIFEWASEHPNRTIYLCSRLWRTSHR